MEEVRKYYGEKIAIYFYFLSHYAQNLGIIGMIGLIVFIMQVTYDVEEYPHAVSTMIFGLIVTFWATFFIYSWRRKEKIFAA